MRRSFDLLHNGPEKTVFFLEKLPLICENVFFLSNYSK